MGKRPTARDRTLHSYPNLLLAQWIAELEIKLAVLRNTGKRADRSKALRLHARIARLKRTLIMGEMVQP